MSMGITRLADAKAIEPKRRDGRERLLDGARQLLAEKGYAGMELRDVAERGEAPRGSIYHHFPGGKEELGAEAIRIAGRTYNALIQVFFENAADAVSATEAFFDGAGVVLEMTDYEDACPIATVALEVASTSEPMRIASGDVFESWIADVAQDFVRLGMPEERTRPVAVELLMLIEGAFLLCRSWKSTEPMKIAGRAAVQTVREAFE